VLNDDLERMRRHLDEASSDEREEEICLLYGQMDRYEDIIDEAEHVTHKQRSTLRANMREIASNKSQIST